MGVGRGGGGGQGKAMAPPLDFILLSFKPNFKDFSIFSG